MIHEKRSLPEYLLKEQEYVYTEESAEITAHGVYMNRLQSIVVVLDKVRYLLNRPGQLADPPLHWLEGSEVIHHVWKGPSSLIGELTVSRLFRSFF